MKNRNSEDFNFSQSAVDNIQVKGNFSVGGDISQNQIINLLRDQDTNVEGIRVEYREKIEALENYHKASVRSAQERVRTEMKAFRDETFRATQEKYVGAREIMRENPIFGSLFKSLDHKISKGEKIIDGDYKELYALDLFAYFNDKLNEDKTKKGVERNKDDLETIDTLINTLKSLSNLNPLSIEDDQVLNDTLLVDLSEDSKTYIKSIREQYIFQRRVLEDNFKFKKEKYQKERDIKIYAIELKQCLKQDEYPLKLSSLKLLESHRGEAELSQTEVEVVEKNLIEPYCRDQLEEYKQIYESKLSERFPLSLDVCTEIKEFRKKLGLNDFSFLRSKTKQIEQELVKPFYEENLQKYEQEYKQKLDQEGFPLSLSTISELNEREKALGLGSFQFQDCPESVSVKEKLIKPFYQANLQSYSKEYKRKIYEFGVGFAEKNIVDLDDLKSGFGLDYSYLKSFGIQIQFMLEADLLNVEKIAKDLFYVESLKYYGQEFRREIESKGYCAEQSNNMKDSLQELGIRREDIIVIEGLVKNNWTIEHLFDKRDSEVSYWKLINLLAEHEWQKADTLTRDLVLELSNSSDKGLLDKEAIEKFPRKDIYTLDQLWIEYSQGNFGFSVQKEIFDSVDQKEQKFGEKVQWRGSTPVLGRFTWKSYGEIVFDLSAPRGHLPILIAKDRKIFTDNFLYLKVWDFRESINSKSGSESSTDEIVVQGFYETSDSKSDPSMTNILSQSFQKIFESINQFEIKNKVDKMGIDEFINSCAILAATTGAASGFGGFTTMIVGVPFDVINNVLQQFRVTLGVIYYKKRIYKVSFSELITIVGVSIGVEVGATLTKSVMISIANKIIVRLSASAAGKAVPFLGAAIGGSVNYGFVKAIGAAVKRIDMNAYTFQAEGSASESGGH